MWLFHGSKFDFLGIRRRAYLLSGTVILVGIVAMIYNVFTIGSWQNYGVDFTGGTVVQVKFSSGTVTAGQLRSALGGSSSPPITKFGQGDEFVIRAPLAQNADVETVASGIENQIKAANLGDFQVERTELVGPTIGRELQEKAGLAILFSFVLTLIYLAIRFEFRFGLAAVVATVHDIMVTLGFLALFRLEVALPMVAAILTIVGYSLNDTIVVFDRIREELNSKGGRREPIQQLVNRAINETLPRTLLTSGTTVVVLVALLLLGGAVIRNFALVLTLGIVVGTYSSIFVASAALVEIQNKYGTGKKEKKRSRKTSAIPV